MIYPSANYYLTGDGVTERNDWAIQVSNKDFLEYYRNDKAELFTSVTNIIKFFNGFFNMDLDTLTHQLSLNLIAKYFSTHDKKISINIQKVTTDESNMKISDITYYISRPETEYKYDDPILYKITSSRTVIVVGINDEKYIWSLFEMYIADQCTYKNKYITGHSVIYTF